jgi:hypothetical protein
MRAEWPELTTLWFVKNQIGSEGVRHLTGANWPLLQYIDISIIKLFRR